MPQQLIATALARHPYHAPGKGWNYSNTNYALAGLVIEKASGRTYAQQLRRTVIEPLGLRRTTVPGTTVEVPAPRLRDSSKLGENDSSARVHDVTGMSPTGPNAAGEIISTAPDLTRFPSALMSGRLVPDPWLRQMRTTVPLNGHLSYGLGLLARKLPCGKTVWGHGGQIQGYLPYAAATGDGGGFQRSSHHRLSAATVSVAAVISAASRFRRLGLPGRDRFPSRRGSTTRGSWVVLVVAGVIGDLTLQNGLRQPLAQLLQQPALAGQLQTLGLVAPCYSRDKLPGAVAVRPRCRQLPSIEGARRRSPTCGRC